MTKRNVLFLILDLIFVAAFNAIFFVMKGTEHTSAVWLCYGFLHFAYIMLCVTPFFKAKGKSSYIMNSVLYFVTGLYFVAELIIGIVFMFFRDFGFKPVFVIQIILTAIYLVVLFANLIANDATENSEQKQ